MSSNTLQLIHSKSKYQLLDTLDVNTFNLKGSNIG